MKFTWKGLILAPLVAPFLFSWVLTCATDCNSPLIGFLFFLLPGCIVSYGTTVFIFLPCLYVVSKLMTPRYPVVCMLGTMLGAFAFFPLAWVMFKSSGPDSGPPIGTFVGYLWECRNDAMTWMFPISGLMTAALYWVLGNNSADAKDRVPPGEGSTT